MYLVLCK